MNLPVMAFESPMVQAALSGWADTDPDAAAAWFEKESSPDKDFFYLTFVRNLRSTYPDKAWNSLLHCRDKELVEHEAGGTLLDWASKDPLAASSAWNNAPDAFKTRSVAESLGTSIGYADPSLKETIASGITESALKEAFNKAVDARVEQTRGFDSE
jgi:hypothetical protein